MDQDQMNFMHNILEKSAISQETFITPAGLRRLPAI